MKKMTTILGALLISSTVFAITLQDLAGKYAVTSDLVPASNIITIDSNGGVTLVENSDEGSLSCKGSSILKLNKISSKMTCANGSSFEQIINLSDVINLDSFLAPVYSTLFGQEIIMKFNKIKD